MSSSTHGGLDMQKASDEYVMSDQDLARLLSSLEHHTGMKLQAYRKQQLASRMSLYLRTHGLTADALSERVRLNPGLARDIHHHLTIHVTSFFRDPECWKELGDLIRRQPSRPRWHAWSAGTSIGAEAISIVGLFHTLGSAVDVLATDVDAVALDEARSGLYPAAMTRDVPPDLLDRLLTPAEGNWWTVRPEVQRRIRYQVLDLLAGPYPGQRFDLILCRNVLIYFDSPDRDRVLGALSERLTARGLLLLSATEVLLSCPSYGLARVGPGLYQKMP